MENAVAKKLNKISNLKTHEMSRKSSLSARGFSASEETLQFYLKMRKELKIEKRSRSRSRDSKSSASSISSSKEPLFVKKKAERKNSDFSILNQSSTTSPDIIYLVKGNKIVHVDPIWKRSRNNSNSGIHEKSRESITRSSASSKLYKKSISPSVWIKSRESSTEKKTAATSSQLASSKKTAQKQEEIPDSVVNRILNFFSQDLDNKALKKEKNLSNYALLPKEQEQAKNVEKSPSFSSLNEKQYMGNTDIKAIDEKVLDSNSKRNSSNISTKMLNSLSNLVKPHKEVIFNCAAFLILLGRAPKEINFSNLSLDVGLGKKYFIFFS